MNINELEDSRRAIVGETNWPSPEKLAAWETVDLVKSLKGYSSHAQDLLCHNHTVAWAAWGQAATMIAAEIVSRLEGISWTEAFNRLSD